MGSRMKVLAVDDDVEILDVLGAALASQGYCDITPCLSAAEALREINRSNTGFDCIFLDIAMVPLDGIELCRNIRALPGYETVPIVMLTGKRDKSSIDAAFLAGATDYVTKPFDVVELGARVRVADALASAHKSAASSEARRGAQVAIPFAPNFDEIYPIEGAENVIDLDTLENYVRQLRSSKIQTANIFGVRIDDFEDMFGIGEVSQFVALLDQIASVLSEALSRADGCFLSYAGRGTFVCVLHSNDELTHETLERSIQESFDTHRARFAGAARLPLRAFVGAPITAMSGKTNLSGRTLRVAFARVQARGTAQALAGEEWQRRSRSYRI